MSFDVEKINAIAEQAARDICKKNGVNNVPTGRRIPVLNENWQYQQYYSVVYRPVKCGYGSKLVPVWEHSFE